MAYRAIKGMIVLPFNLGPTPHRTSERFGKIKSHSGERIKNELVVRHT